MEERSYERRNLPTEDEIKNELYQYTIKPYITTSDDGQMCCITEQMAITLINEYCTSLLKSKFTCLSPIWILHRISENSNNPKINKYQVLKVKTILAFSFGCFFLYKTITFFICFRFPLNYHYHLR